MSPQIKYAYKTHNTWIYRRTYPKALQPILGTALKQSLKTSDATQAKARVAELNQTFTSIIKEAQAHALATPHTSSWWMKSSRTALLALPSQVPWLGNTENQTLRWFCKS